MVRRCLPFVLLIALLAAATAGAGQALPPQQGPAAQSDQVRQGVSHFEQAFYKHLPHGRGPEANQEFDLAIAQFELELSRRPSSAAAHSYLGRIHALRKDWRKSGEHYDRLSEIVPENVDALVLAALAYGELGELAEARARLMTARERTTDPAALATLGGYLAKLDALERRAREGGAR